MEEKAWRRLRRRCDMKKVWRRDGRAKGEGMKEGEEEEVMEEEKKS